MYLAATRNLVTKKTRQLNSWNQGLSNCCAGEPLHLPTKYVSGSETLRFYKHQINSYKVNATGTSQEPYLYSSGTACADKTLSMPCIKRPTDSGLDSPYSVSTACLGPFIDGRHWFAEAEDPQEILDKARKNIKDTNRAAIKLNLENDSLENVRKRIKGANLKNPDVPLGWERKK